MCHRSLCIAVQVFGKFQGKRCYNCRCVWRPLVQRDAGKMSDADLALLSKSAILQLDWRTIWRQILWPAFKQLVHSVQAVRQRIWKPMNILIIQTRGGWDYQSKLNQWDIVTRKSLENAAIVAATGEAQLMHSFCLPAIANECRLRYDMFAVGEVLKNSLFGRHEMVWKYVA